MSRRRRSPWAHLPTCPACGGRLIWPTHTPRAQRRTERGPARPIPLDADPTDDRGAPYAVSLSKRTSRWLDEDEEPDVTESRHHSHIYTCPARITPEQLASTPQQNGTPR
ncbi:hypothetical protein [Cellulomonas sp. HZM]|uniref:hypothetical protein n=1 Tax=Cellulomonas sp. HZM TaxID=1454010 RepID=UPI0004937282|nr:hypothetical protein [Cellulomonas sp. HZM]